MTLKLPTWLFSNFFKMYFFYNGIQIEPLFTRSSALINRRCIIHHIILNFMCIFWGKSQITVLCSYMTSNVLWNFIRLRQCLVTLSIFAISSVPFFLFDVKWLRVNLMHFGLGLRHYWESKSWCAWRLFLTVSNFWEMKLRLVWVSALGFSFFQRSSWGEVDAHVLDVCSAAYLNCDVGLLFASSLLIAQDTFFIPAGFILSPIRLFLNNSFVNKDFLVQAFAKPFFAALRLV